MDKERLTGNEAGVGRLTRRAFLGAGVAGAAALAGGRLESLFPVSAAEAADEPWIEATIPQLQALMAGGQFTSRELTQGYLQRIASLNPLLGAVIQTNPNATSIAARLDNERRSGATRGLLHGIPVLVKDNIATDDQMQTTAGSLALVNSKVPSDAPIVARLRAAGAVILGKANLSEWANFRGFAPFNGWSARGGFTREPYLLSFDPCGSSSGSAVAPAANLCTAAVGTETDGSVVCPAGNNLVVGLKPTLGLLSQEGIIPIGHSQDTAGPICRTVTDVAALLGAMQTPFGPAAGRSLPSDYTVFLRQGTLRGARIGVDRRYFTPDYGGEPDLVAVAQQGLGAITDLGATLVDTDTGDSLRVLRRRVHGVALRVQGTDCAIPEHARSFVAEHARRSHRLQHLALPSRDAVFRPRALRAGGIDERRSDRSRLSRSARSLPRSRENSRDRCGVAARPA